MSTTEHNQRTPAGSVSLFQTLPQPCGYYANRVAQNRVIDPAAPNLDQLYPQALAQGYRRAGSHLYRPHCPGCQACVPCRMPVRRFQPNRSQRRCHARNADLDMVETSPGFSDERYQLYCRYLHRRHAGGGMDESDPEDFETFLNTSWSPTRFLELRLHDRLMAVAVTDHCEDCLSAVYTFFDPEQQSRGLGTFAILAQIEWAQRLGLEYLYLGYWIAGHPKMDYKRRFRHVEMLGEHGWSPLARCMSD